MLINQIKWQKYLSQIYNHQHVIYRQKNKRKEIINHQNLYSIEKQLLERDQLILAKSISMEIKLGKAHLEKFLKLYIGN
jgi:hypothetical protein